MSGNKKLFFLFKLLPFFVFLNTCHLESETLKTKEASGEVVGKQQSRSFHKGVELERFNYDGYERYFKYYIPENFQAPVPLVIELHGFKRDPDQLIETKGGFRLLAELEGFVVAWPAAVEPYYHSWDGGFCCEPAISIGYDDVGFIVDVINRMITKTPIDLNRIYVAGRSNGGAMAHRLALQRSDLIAAIAPTSFHLVDNWRWQVPTHSDWLPDYPVPVLHIHGNRDAMIDYPSSLWHGSIKDGFHKWASLNGCKGEAKKIHPVDDGVEYHQFFNDCRQGSRVELMVIDAEHKLELQDLVDVPAKQWQFLKQFSREALVN